MPDTRYLSEAPQTERPNILIVDDQCFNIMAIKAQAESLGCKADSAVSGKMAISLVRNRLREMRKSPVKMYRLILLDYAMPEMDGLETCQGIRQTISQAFTLAKGGWR